MAEISNMFPGDVGVARRRRVFTLEEANRTLPLVRRVVADIVGLYREIAGVQQRLAQDSLSLSEREQLEATAERQEQKFDAFIEELTGIGCELKDANMGLVDFIGRHEGRDVYLCWRMGEEQVGYWHELHSGFAGRRPVSTLNEQGRDR